LRDFKLAAREDFYGQKLEKQSDIVEFRGVGACHVGQRYAELRQFCAGISINFPGISTVESDFSVLNWECDEFRSSLTDFYLEDVMQCKQFKQLQSMKHSVSLHNERPPLLAPVLLKLLHRTCEDK
jgi:hypothetical protein